MGVQIKLSSVKHLKLDKTNKHIVTIYKTLQTEGQIVSFQIENGLLIYLKRMFETFRQLRKIVSRVK